MSDDIKKYMKELKEEFSQETQRYWEKNAKENLKLKEEFSNEAQRYWEKNEKQNLKLKEEFVQENLKFKENLTKENLKFMEEFSNKTQRYIGVLSEDFQHKLDVVVEGHQVLNKKIDDLRDEVRSDIKEVKEMLKLTYRELDNKDHAIEVEVSKLKTRVERLEATQH